MEGIEGSEMEVSSENVQVENLYLSDDEGFEGDGERDRREGHNTEDDGGNDQGEDGRSHTTRGTGDETSDHGEEFNDMFQYTSNGVGKKGSKGKKMPDIECDKDKSVSDDKFYDKQR